MSGGEETRNPDRRGLVGRAVEREPTAGADAPPKAPRTKDENEAETTRSEIPRAWTPGVRNEADR